MKRLLATVVAVLALAGCSTGKDAVSQGSDFAFVSPGGKTDVFYDGADRKPIPKLSGDDLMNEGKQISVADYTGKVVVINIWGQWCPPCRTESPEIEKLYQQEQAAGVPGGQQDVLAPRRRRSQPFACPLTCVQDPFRIHRHGAEPDRRVRVEPGRLAHQRQDGFERRPALIPRQAGDTAGTT